MSNGQQIFEVTRSLLRSQLDFLNKEGAIQDDDYIRLLATHRRTVGQESDSQTSVQQDDVPPGSLKSYDAIRQILGEICSSLLPWSEIMEKLDVMKKLDATSIGIFERDNPELLSKDILTAVLLIRNQSLYSIYEVGIAIKIETKSYLVVDSELGEDALDFYHELKLSWMEAIATDELPQRVVARRVLERSQQRSGITNEFQPLNEVVMANLLTITEIGAWHQISQVWEIIP